MKTLVAAIVYMCMSGQCIEYNVEIEKKACSYGSFVPALLNLTDYTLCIYVPSYFCELRNALFNDKAKIININLDEYRNKIGDWHNTEEQKEIMISL